MKSRRSGVEKRVRKIVACLMAIMMLSLLAAALPCSSSAGSAPDQSSPATQLEVRAGYPGGTYTTVKSFQRSDLEAMPQVQQVYTFIDNMPCPVVDPASGVSLADILSDAGIDVDSMQGITTHSTDGYSQNYSSSFLFGATRYYFPHIADNWDTVNKKVYFPDPAAAVADAVEAPTIIAIGDNWQRAFPGNVDAGGKPVDSGFSNLTDASRYRLVFGETDPPVIDAYLSAKWIYEIDVILDGTAVTGVSLNKTSSTVAAGGTDQLTATITPADATNQSVAWTSSNPAVATVSGTGLVTAAAAGRADITVTTADGAKTATCAVKVTSPPGGGTGGGGVTEAGAVLTVPAPGQTYHPGDRVVIAGTAQSLSTVSVTVTGPDGQVVYTANEVVVSGSSFTAGFNLGSDAKTGNYTVTIAGTGLANALTATFTVIAAASPAASATEVNSNPASNPGVAPNFSDLSNCWAQKQIADLLARGVLQGVTPDQFMPDADTTRAQFATMLNGVLRISPRPEAEPEYADVLPGAWYYGNVSAAVYAGLISGYSDHLFGPDDPVTREQMAAMVARALLSYAKATKPDQPGSLEALAGFRDQQNISVWARADAALVVQLGIIHGRTGAVFAPQDKATRAEAAVMLWELAAFLQQAGGAASAAAS